MQKCLKSAHTEPKMTLNIQKSAINLILKTSKCRDLRTFLRKFDISQIQSAYLMHSISCLCNDFQ